VKRLLKLGYDRLTIDYDADGLGGHLAILIVHHVYLIGTAGLTRDVHRKNSTVTNAAEALRLDLLTDCIEHADFKFSHNIRADANVELAVIRTWINNDGRELVDRQLTLRTLVDQDRASVTE
jgi:hypothetical protein